MFWHPVVKGQWWKSWQRLITFKPKKKKKTSHVFKGKRPCTCKRTSLVLVGKHLVDMTCAIVVWNLGGGLRLQSTRWEAPSNYINLCYCCCLSVPFQFELNDTDKKTLIIQASTWRSCSVKAPSAQVDLTKLSETLLGNMVACRVIVDRIYLLQMMNENLLVGTCSFSQQKKKTDSAKISFLKRIFFLPYFSCFVVLLSQQPPLVSLPHITNFPLVFCLFLLICCCCCFVFLRKKNLLCGKVTSFSKNGSWSHNVVFYFAEKYLIWTS